jgi:hypothetical protein
MVHRILRGRAWMVLVPLVLTGCTPDHYFDIVLTNGGAFIIARECGDLDIISVKLYLGNDETVGEPIWQIRSKDSQPRIVNSINLTSLDSDWLGSSFPRLDINEHYSVVVELSNIDLVTNFEAWALVGTKGSDRLSRFDDYCGIRDLPKD